LDLRIYSRVQDWTPLVTPSETLASPILSHPNRHRRTLILVLLAVALAAAAECISLIHTSALRIPINTISACNMSSLETSRWKPVTLVAHLRSSQLWWMLIRSFWEPHTGSSMPNPATLTV